MFLVLTSALLGNFLFKGTDTLSCFLLLNKPRVVLTLLTIWYLFLSVNFVLVSCSLLYLFTSAASDLSLELAVLLPRWVHLTDLLVTLNLLQVGDWRDRIIIFTGIFGPTQALTKALLDSGAKAVVCPSSEPEEMQLVSFYRSDLGSFKIGRFEIGEEEGEDEDIEPNSPASDWEDSEPEKNVECTMSFWDDDEKELSQFMSELYESLFLGGGRVDIALKSALASHRSLRYSCHLPSTL